MARQRRQFDITIAPRALRRTWVRNSWRAARANQGREGFSLTDAWNQWPVEACGPQTWGRITERNHIRCAA
jgi:hypothetical protein